MTLLKPLTILSFVVLCISGCDSTVPSNSAELSREIGTVTLEVDFGADKRSKSIDVVCSPESTVLLSLERAQNMKKLKVDFRGTGETAFVTSIGGVENMGSEGKNWIFRVNDKLGDKSAGVYPVKPGDKISWSYGNPPKELQ
jgi:hypothetical protein